MSHYPGPADYGHANTVGYGPGHDAPTRKPSTLGIVAVATDRGRAFGVAAIALGVVAGATLLTMTFGSVLWVSMG